LGDEIEVFGQKNFKKGKLLLYFRFQVAEKDKSTVDD